MTSTIKVASPAAPVPLALLRVPLEFFVAEHLRQRQFLGFLEQVTAAEALAIESATDIATFLRNDVALHIVDEEDDLFPLMRRRCPEEDEIENVLSVLARDHVAARQSADWMVNTVVATSDPSGTDIVLPSLRAAAAEFIRRGRLHIALENAVLLPLARIRLRPADLAELSARMETRRNRIGAVTT